MSCDSTRLLAADVVRDLSATLARLRLARTVGDEAEIRVSEQRLNWLLETRIPRKESRGLKS